MTKFHGFKVPRIKGPGKVVFGVFFYFFGRPIVKFIIIRLRITYNSRLRNLQTIAESARSDCTIADPSLMGMLSNEGINVNYNCEANATQGDASTANFTLNTDVPMTMVNTDGTTEALDFQEVNFNGEAAEESSNIQANTQVFNNIYTLKNTIIFVEKFILAFTGNLEQSSRRCRRLSLTDGQTIAMSLQDDDGSIKKYDCIINEVSSPVYKISCDASSKPITTTVSKLHLSSGISEDGSFLTIEMDGYGTPLLH